MTVQDSLEWEQYAMELVAARHGEAFQRIPPERRGDLGLEGFTRSGQAYQCYCPLEPLTPDERYKKHRDKLTRDLRKLSTNVAELQGMLGSTRIKDYVFLLRQWDDPRLIQHCTSKATELREAKLPIIDALLGITVQTEDDFPAERDALAVATRRAIALELDIPAEETRTAWAKTHGELVDALDKKLAVLGLEADEQGLLVGEMLGHYLASQEALRLLQERHPSVRLRVDNLIYSRERSLRAEGLLSDQSAQGRLRDVVHTLSQQVSDENPAIRDYATDIALGAASEWLMRCPLELR
jgi:hypothetical protein